MTELTGRAQCIVHRKGKILLVKHRRHGEEWWCLPGGAIEPGETPEQAAVRELQEECCVDGKIIRETGIAYYSAEDRAYTFEADIGSQEPRLGVDPEESSDNPVLVDVKWLSLGEVSEKDRAYLWTYGLLGIGDFRQEVSAWGDSISYPGTAA